MPTSRDLDTSRDGTHGIGLAVILAHPGPAAILNADGRILTCNRRGEILRDLFSPDSATGLMAIARTALENGTPVTKAVEVRQESQVGSLDLTLLPVSDDRRVAVIGRDTSLELNLRAALADSRQRYKDFVDLSSDFTWETGTEGRFVFVSPTGALGYEARELVDAEPWSMMDAKEVQSGAKVFQTTMRVKDAEIWARRKDGSLACLVTSAMPIMGPDGKWTGARGVCHDVTEQRERDKALNRARNRERILTHVVRTFRDEMDPSNMLNVAAEALARGLGTEACHIFRATAAEDNGPPEFVRRGSFGLGGGEDEAMEVLDGLDSSGLPQETETGRWRILAAAARYRRQINGAVLLWRAADRGGWTDDDRLLIMDIANQIGIANEQIGQHERIITMSRTDSLTGLLNRRAFFEDMDRRYRRLERSPQPSALLYVDLDNFKRVNDSHGHLRGDEALLVVKDILVTHTRPTDMVARLGGDEFGVWLDGATAEVASTKAQDFLNSGNRLRPFDGDPDHPLSMSIGLAVYDPSTPETLEDLTARADGAMYQAKHAGKSHFRVAPPAKGQGESSA
ncbi:MAG: diguanylate cyclase [Rhodospirillum sp.]|nr:diguanylate cyclase [Rhodospirillum sp.]MCF8491525.1 diguanylate cyclase [Rhodospirillum sp.]MCF8501405.1 diguanylate cyclase [Rhodospirillum sp.]